MTGEDFQPNEALEKVGSGRIVPVIRTSRHQRYRHPNYKQTHPVPSTQHPRWQRRTPSLPRRPPTDTAQPDQSRQQQDVYAHSRHNHTDAVSRNYALHNNALMSAGPSSSTVIGPAFRRKPLDPRFGSPRPYMSPARIGEDMQISRRRVRAWEAVDDGTPKKRTKKPTRKYQEMVIDLPPECRKGAFRRSHFKAIFLTQHLDGLNRTMDVEVVQHHFTDTQLIITYSVPAILPDARSNAASEPEALNTDNSRLGLHPGPNLKLESPYRGDVSLGMANSSSDHSAIWGTLGQGSTPLIINTPSGSNVKLEDLYKRVPSLEATEEARTLKHTRPTTVFHKGSTSYSSVVQVIDVPRQMASRPRSIRSGVATLDYGPPNLQDDYIRSEDRAQNLSEVIEIHDTPPQSPERETGPNDMIDTIVSDVGNTRAASTDLENQVERLAKPEPNARRERLLEDYTFTNVQIPRTSGDKARRLLVSHSQDNLYLTTMHGFVHEISMKTRTHIRELLAPLSADKGSVEDVCLFAPPFDSMALRAQAQEDNALSVLNFAGDRDHRVTPVARTSSDRDRHLRGVSAITTLPSSVTSLSFVSAGYDHVMHLWSFNAHTTFEQPVAGLLDVHHSSLIQSLLSVRERLISGGADNSVRTWDLHAAQMVSTIRTSNSVYQLHRTDNPETVLIEVGHRDLQFELHDCRISSEGRSMLRFGYPSAQGANGRYVRGAVDPYEWTTFVSGGRDGIARLWDLRNAKQCRQEIMCFPGQKVVHAAFARNSIVVASEDNRLLFFESAHI